MNIKALLIKIGLKPKEAALFLAAVELGSGSVQDIAARAGVSRPTAYSVLEALREKGLVTTFRKKNIRYYAADDLDNIVSWSEQRLEALKKTLPTLRRLAGAGRRRPTVRFYEGKDEIHYVLEEIIRGAARLYAIASADDLFQTVEDFEHFVKRRIEKKIPLQVILRDSLKARERQARGRQELREVRLLDSRYEFHGLTYIWKDNVAIFTFGQKVTATVIQNHDVVEMERAKFERLWDSLLPSNNFIPE